MLMFHNPCFMFRVLWFADAVPMKFYQPPVAEEQLPATSFQVGFWAHAKCKATPLGTRPEPEIADRICFGLLL